MSSRPTWRFDDVVVDLRSWRLERDGCEIAIEPKGLEALAVLLERAGEVVSKDELIEAVWRDTAVTDNAVARAIAHVRGILGDDPRRPRYIETVHRRGYRFVAPVEQVPAADALQEPPANGQPLAPAGPPVARRRTWPVLGWTALAGVLLAAVTVLLLLDRFRSPAALATARNATAASLAILPLQNLGGPDRQYFADGMTEAITTQLAKLGDLKVIARSAVMRYRDERPAPSEIGRALDVAFLVEGSTLLERDRVRITAHLVDTASDRSIWAESYEGDLEDVLRLQSRVATGIAREVHRLTTEQESLLAETRTVDRVAYDEYLRGLAESERSRGSNESFLLRIRQAIEHFARAAERDPEWGAAHAELAGAWSDLASMSDDREERRRANAQARRSAERALELDANLATAHRVLAGQRASYDAQEAEEGFREAMRLEPNDADTIWAYALLLRYQGRFEESVALLRRAQERDPTSPYFPYSIGLTLVCAERLEEAGVELESLRRGFPDDPHVALLRAVLLNRQGRFAEAVDLLEAHREELWQSRATSFLEELAYAEARAGRPERARAALRELVELGGVEPPWVLAALGDQRIRDAILEKRSRLGDGNAGAMRCWP